MLDCFNKKRKHSYALACQLKYGNSDRTSILLVLLCPQHFLFWLLFFILLYIADNIKIKDRYCVSTHIGVQTISAKCYILYITRHYNTRTQTVINCNLLFHKTCVSEIESLFTIFAKANSASCLSRLMKIY